MRFASADECVLHTLARCEAGACASPKSRIAHSPARWRGSPALQPGTRTLVIEIDIPNPDGALKPGIYGTVDLHIPRKTQSVVVPAEAIIFNRDGLQVAVIENGTAHIHKVSVVRDMGTQVEINDGLKDGDLVILNPPIDLVDGRRVQARPEPARSSN